MHTRRGGAAAKAGHDLVIHVTSWQGTLELGAEPATTSVALTADATSLRVHKGTGGVQALGDKEKSSIHKTIDEDVLKRQDIVFRSTRVQGAAATGVLSVEGELTLAGKREPMAFDVEIGDDGRVSATAVVTQTRWGDALLRDVRGEQGARRRGGARRAARGSAAVDGGGYDPGRACCTYTGLNALTR